MPQNTVNKVFSERQNPIVGGCVQIYEEQATLQRIASMLIVQTKCQHGPATYFTDII